MKHRGIFEYEYPVEHKPSVGIDVHLHGDCVKGKVIEWEYKSIEQPTITLDELKAIREEISKNKLFPTVFVNPHESAKNAYREAVNNDLAILDKKIAELEGKDEV